MITTSAALASILGATPPQKVRITPKVIENDCKAIIDKLLSGDLVHDLFFSALEHLNAGQETGVGFSFEGINNDILINTIIFKDESGEPGLGIALTHFDKKESLLPKEYLAELSRYQLALFKTYGQNHSSPIQFSVGKYRPRLDLPEENAFVARFKLSDCKIGWNNPGYNEPLVYSALLPDQEIPYLFAAVKK